MCIFKLENREKEVLLHPAVGWHQTMPNSMVFYVYKANGQFYISLANCLFLEIKRKRSSIRSRLAQGNGLCVEYNRF